jgi:itaconate CoA-transferase
VKRASIPKSIAVIRGHPRAPVQRLRRSSRLVRGAYASKGGKSIIATRSTAAGGKISRIVPRLEEPVATRRIDTHYYVVTEFGSASLEGLSSTERAHALIGLAHPQFRDELTAAAKKLNLI